MGRTATLRSYKACDLERIKALHHRQGFEFQFPDLNDPIFAISSIADDGEIQAAAFLKITAEAFLFLNPEFADARTRWKTLLRIHEDVRRQASEAGLSEVTAWIPPNLSKAFQRRLSKLGWQEEPQEWRRRAYHLRNVTL